MLSQILYNSIVMFLWDWPVLEGGCCSLPALCDQIPLRIWSCLLAALRNGHFKPVWCCCHLEPLCCPVGRAGSQTTLSSPCSSKIPVLAHKCKEMCMEELAVQEECRSARLQCWCLGKVWPWQQPWGSPGHRGGALAGLVLHSWVLEPSALGAEGGFCSSPSQV